MYAKCKQAIFSVGFHNSKVKYGHGKGVSDLEECVNYFVFPGSSCENMNFSAHFS